MWVLIAMLFILKWQQPNCPSNDGWINIVYTYTTENYLTERIPHATI